MSNLSKIWLLETGTADWVKSITSIKRDLKRWWGYIEKKKPPAQKLIINFVLLDYIPKHIKIPKSVVH